MSETNIGAPQQTDTTGTLYGADGRPIGANSYTSGVGMDQFIGYVRAQPVSAILLAFGLGYMVGKII
jgi:hypothetical protein